MHQDQPTPLKIKIIYALGQFGWSLGYYAIGNLLIAFYFAPENETEYNFPEFISPELVFGFFTIFGLVAFFGRLFDAITDPIIANFSDKFESKFGKRRPFLLISALPFAVFSVLAFYPISESSTTNAIWLALNLFLFFIFFTLYTVPYSAWMSELGKTNKERLNISTLISVTWALGFAFGNFIHQLVAYFEKQLDITTAFQYAVASVAFVAFIFMLLPAIFIDEKKYSISTSNNLDTKTNLSLVWQNKNFRTFALSDLFYWMALTSIQTGILYYVTILLQEPKENITAYLTVMFLFSFVLYYPVNILAKKLGKKILINTGYIIFMLVFISIFFINHTVPSSIFYAIILASAIPMAIFGILPNAIIADVANKDFKASHQNKAAMYFGLRMFMMKIGIAFTTLVFPSLLYFGRSATNDFGVRLTLIFAVFVCCFGLYFFNKFKFEEDS